MGMGTPQKGDTHDDDTQDGDTPKVTAIPVSLTGACGSHGMGTPQGWGHHGDGDTKDGDTQIGTPWGWGHREW